MKRVITLLVVIAMTVSVVACGNPTSQNPADSKTDAAVRVPSKGSEASGENTVVLNGKTYTLPIPFQDLLADGWEAPLERPEFQVPFNPGRIHLAEFNINHPDGGSAFLFTFINTGDSPKLLTDCLVTGIIVKIPGNAQDFSIDFEFPGGITNSSTKEDVFDVYGDLDIQEHFETTRIITPETNDDSYRFSPPYAVKGYVYENHLDSGSTFIFYFDENEKLCGVEFFCATK